MRKNGVNIFLEGCMLQSGGKGFCSIRNETETQKPFQGLWLGPVLEAKGVAVNRLRTCSGMMDRDSRKSKREAGNRECQQHSGVQITGC
jgi:hypothetical protein